MKKRKLLLIRLDEKDFEALNTIYLEFLRNRSKTPGSYSRNRFIVENLLAMLGIEKND